MKTIDIQRCIVDFDGTGSCLAYLLDIALEDHSPRLDRPGRPSRNHHENATGRLAHKLTCSSRYRTRRAVSKAMRRLLRLAARECPDLLERAWAESEEALAPDPPPPPAIPAE